MERKLVYKSELIAHTKEGVGYITRQILKAEEDSLLLQEISKIVEGEEIRYCFRCGCEWLNILLEGDVIFSTKKAFESDLDKPLEERSLPEHTTCIECGADDSEVIRKTDFLDKTSGV